MGQLKPPGPCALAHEAPATHVCVSESHGLVRLCAHHAGDHASRPGHEVVTLKRAGELLRNLRRAGRRGRPKLEE